MKINHEKEILNKSIDYCNLQITKKVETEIAFN